MRVLVYCQHVLGMGHLYRSLEIVRAFAASQTGGGHDVVFVTGGPEAPVSLPPGVRHEQLPGLRMDEQFSQLLPVTPPPDIAPEEALESIKKERRARLLEIVQECRPHVFLVELYPFGRRQFGFELLPALELAHSGRLGPCRTVCSVRDILVEKKDQAKYERRVLAPLNKHFDLVLVHSDPEAISLERTFSRMADVRPAITYTGYVAQQPGAASGAALRAELGMQDDEYLVVASAGSGSVGGELLEAVIRASSHLAEALPHRLAVFSGPLMDATVFTRLQSLAKQQPHVRLRRHSKRFPAWLDAASLSVSMGGYNTVLALAAANRYGLVLPFAQNREQRMRAELLQQRGLLGVLAPEDLEPERLAGRMRQALLAPPERSAKLDIKGAQKTVACLEHLQSRPIRRGAVKRTPCQPWLDHTAAEESFFEHLQDLCARYKTAQVFFRADDVAIPGKSGGALEQLLSIFLRHETPLWPAVVPAWLTEAHWRTLQKISRSAPLFCWHQHGWRHAGHEICGKNSEFGSGRALALKKQDLIKGRDRLAQIMGREVTPCFTPPWNRMSSDALALLPEIGLQAISGDAKLCAQAAALSDLLSLPVHLDLHTRKEGAATQAWRGMLADIETGLATGRLGVMLHHQRMNKSACDTLDRILSVLQRCSIQAVGREIL